MSDTRDRIPGASVFDQMVEHVACYERDGTFLYSNPPHCELIGHTNEELLGRNLWKLFPEVLGGAFHAAFERVARSGEPERIEHLHEKSRRWYASRLFLADGRVWAIGQDITEEKLAASRLDVLTTASRLFAEAASDLDMLFDSVAQHLAETLGDACVIRLLSEDRTWFEEPVGTWDRDPAVAEVLRGAPAVLAHEVAGGEILRTRRALVLANVEPRTVGQRIAPPGRAHVVEQLGIHSILVVPLKVHDQVLGIISVFRRLSGTRSAYTATDLRLAEELSDRAALVVNQWRAYRLVEESRRRLLLIGDALPALVSLIDKESRYQFANAAYQTWFGSPPSDVIGKTMAEVLGAPAYGTIEPYVRRALAGETVTYEARLPYVTGGARDIQATYTPYEEGGEVEGFVALVMDISDRVRLTNELRASERRMSTIFENAPFAICLARVPSMMIAKVNEAYVRLFGYSKDELVGKTTAEVGMHLDLAARKRASEEFQRQGFVHNVELHIVTKAGQNIVVNTNVDLIELDGEPHVLATVQDITQQKRAEEALRDSESRFRALADHMSQLAWMADETGARLWFNRRWFEFTGTTLEEVQGWGWQKLYPPEETPRVAERYRHHLERGEPWTETFPLRGKNGEYRWFLTQVVPVQDQAGKVVRWFGTKTDVTEEREAEATLRRAVQLRDEFISVASHELRTPLTALRLSLEGLQKVLARGVNADSHSATRKLDIAVRQVVRLGTLIEGLLDVSRLFLGRLRLELESFDLGELARETIERVSELAARAQVELRLDVRGDVRGTWDHARLDQVLINILTNAIKYGPRAPVDVVLESSGDVVELQVRDHGIGISIEDQDRIFGRFERAVPTKHYGGLGLGLYIAREIVEAHGGEIQVDSSPGNGATFTVRLPRVVHPHLAEGRPNEGAPPG